jgi:RNA polymerase sigma-70 factor (ECF subfamily)
LQEQRDWIAHGMRHLPLEQKMTMELAYYLGHSCEEIAQIMNCPVSTVKARMFHARVKLRNLLPRLGGQREGAP